MFIRRIVAVTFVASLFCTALSSDALASPFLVGDFITYSQDSWGTPNPPASDLLVAEFFTVYPGGGVNPARCTP